jgi:hypothetical protein
VKSSRVEALLEQSREANPNRRRAAVRELCPCDVRANRDDVWNRIFDLASDDDVGVRRLVFHALIDGSPREREAQVVETAEAMANDPSPKLRRQARKLVAEYRRTGRVNIGG